MPQMPSFCVCSVFRLHIEYEISRAWRLVVYVEPNRRLQQLSQALYVVNEVTATHKVLRQGPHGATTHDTLSSTGREPALGV